MLVRDSNILNLSFLLKFSPIFPKLTNNLSFIIIHGLVVLLGQFFDAIVPEKSKLGRVEKAFGSGCEVKSLTWFDLQWKKGLSWGV